MNKIIDLIKTPYQLHLEDDWLFLEPTELIKPGLEILNGTKFEQIDLNLNDRFYIGEKKIAQILFNKNYTEIEERVVQGGYLFKTTNGNNFLIHEHFNPSTQKELYNKAMNKYKANCIYWPHFSFRPSIIDTSIYKKLGYFNNSNGFFEREYANRYFASNYISGFYNKVICRHIGKLTSESNSEKIPSLLTMNT